MKSIRTAVATTLLAMTMLLGVIHASHAAERVADPAVWGVYAKLVGTGWKGEFGARATRWGEGDQIIEDDETFGRSVITPGPTSGTLVLKLGSTGLHTFRGTIASDGSVLWIREGMLKMPYRVLLQDGALREEQVKLSGREVASVKRTLRYQLVPGPEVGSQTLTPIVASKNSPGVAASVASESVVASANAKPEAIWGIYAKLIGSTLKIGRNGPPASWRWGTADEIIENHNGLAARKIRRGAAVGELLMLQGRNFDQVWKGTVGTDGSVVFVPAKEANWLMEEPSRRIRLAGDVVIVEVAKVKDGRVVNAWESFRYFGQIVGADHAGPAAEPKPAPVTTAVAASTGNTAITPALVAAPSANAPPTEAPVGPAAVVRFDPVSIFGPIGSLVGKTFVSDRSKLELYSDEEGNAFVMHFGIPNGPRGTKYVFRAGDKPGIFQGEMVYHVGSAAIVGFLKSGGSFHVFDSPKFRSKDTPHNLYTVEGADLIQTSSYGGLQTRYVLATQDGLNLAQAGRELYLANVESAAQAKRDEKRADQQRAATFYSALQGVAQDLAEEPSGSYAEAQANLDATVANINAAAAVERQQQALAQQQAQARAAEEQRQQLAANARWVAEKEQSAAEYRSGRVDAAAAREAQVVAQQQADQQRRAAATVERQNAEQTATVGRQQAQSAAISDPSRAKLGSASNDLAQAASRQFEPARNVQAQPARNPGTAGGAVAPTSTSAKARKEVYVFFIDVGGATQEFRGPSEMTKVEAKAETDRLSTYARTLGGVVRVKDRPNCGFVYSLPKTPLHAMGTGTTQSDAEASQKNLVGNQSATVLSSIVCAN